VTADLNLLPRWAARTPPASTPPTARDLLGGMHRHQAQEFASRARTIPAIDVVRGATAVADVTVLAESRLAAVVQDGRVVVGNRAAPA